MLLGVYCITGLEVCQRVLRAVVGGWAVPYNQSRVPDGRRTSFWMHSTSWPNRVTAARIFLIWPFVICLLNQQAWWWARWAALGMFGVMAVTDALDGFLARRLNVHSPLGKLLDPLADKLLVTCSVVILAIPGSCVLGKPVPNWVVVAAIGKDLVVLLGFLLIYLSTGRVFTEPRAAGKACTVVQFGMVVAVLAWPDLPGAMGWLPNALWWSATLLAGIAVADYTRVGMRFVAAVDDDSRE